MNIKDKVNFTILKAKLFLVIKVCKKLKSTSMHQSEKGFHFLYIFCSTLEYFNADCRT